MNTRASARSEWTEIGHGCYVRRYPEDDVTIGAVVGSAGILLIDTGPSEPAAALLAEELRGVFDVPVRWVVNTHWHYDHSFGNAQFAEATIYGHASVPGTLAERAEQVRAELAAGSATRARDLAELTVVPPHQTLALAAPIDLGDRYVEAVHPGAAHTEGDLMVHVADADVLFVGDLVEESGPPAYGDDCYPLSWPDALDQCAGLLTEATVVVPGHGAPVDRAFVHQQREAITEVARQVHELARQGVPEHEALASSQWPFPAELMTQAVRRGYAELGGPGPRQLPIVEG